MPLFTSGGLGLVILVLVLRIWSCLHPVFYTPRQSCNISNHSAGFPQNPQGPHHPHAALSTADTTFYITFLHYSKVGHKCSVTNSRRDLSIKFTKPLSETLSTQTKGSAWLGLCHAYHIVRPSMFHYCCLKVIKLQLHY